MVRVVNAYRGANFMNGHGSRQEKSLCLFDSAVVEILDRRSPEVLGKFTAEPVTAFLKILLETG